MLRVRSWKHSRSQAQGGYVLRSAYFISLGSRRDNRLQISDRNGFANVKALTADRLDFPLPGFRRDNRLQNSDRKGFRPTRRRSPLTGLTSDSLFPLVLAATIGFKHRTALFSLHEGVRGGQPNRVKLVTLSYIPFSKSFPLTSCPQNTHKGQ
jgi:hypothetical protein